MLWDSWINKKRIKLRNNSIEKAAKGITRYF
jgi:hypothetical protein